MAEDEVKKKRRFKGPYRAVLYSAIIFPGMGQLVEGMKAKGGLLALGTLICLFLGLGRFMYASLTADECPMDLSGIGDLFECFGWTLSDAWGRTGTWVLICLGGLVAVYLISVGDAWLAARARLAKAKGG